MPPKDSFVFGKDFSPGWFNYLVSIGVVEWANEHGRVVGCYCKNRTGVTLAKMIGDIVTASDFFSSVEEMEECCKKGDENE